MATNFKIDVMGTIELEFDFGYFKSFEDYFWLWEDFGEVISIDKGSTIAYREQIIPVLEVLSEQGLPPFGALLLAIVATNQTPGDDIAFIKEKLTNHLMKGNTSETGYINAMEDAVRFLYLLKEMPEDFRVGEKRTLLFQTLFESCHNILSVKESKNIISLTKDEIRTDRDKFLSKITQRNFFNISCYHKDFRCVGLLLRKFPSVQKILEAMQSVPKLDLSMDEQREVTSPKDKSLLQDLMEDDQTFFSSSLVKHIWSGLKIPLHHNFPSDRPLGGVSDLTNKGDLDKLLITEYANDDLVFASRLANNEVLFLRREIPPISDRQERVILIDISLKTWGTPKTIAFAVMLAITQHPKTTVSSKVFLVGDSYHEININSVEEVVSGLQFVNTCLDPSQGIENFLREYTFLGIPEIFFITTAEIYRFPSVQKVILENRKQFKYNVITDAEGRIELFLFQRNARKLVQEMKLPLEKLWESPTRINTDDQVFRNMELNEYPILFPMQNNVRSVFVGLNKEIFVITTDRFVFKTVDKFQQTRTKGMKRLKVEVPVGTSHLCMGYNSEENDLLLCFSSNSRKISLINLENGVVKECLFDQWKSEFSQNFFFHEKQFILLLKSACWYLNPETLEFAYSDYGKEIDELKKIHIEFREKLDMEKNSYRAGNISLRNLTQIYINAESRLVVNKHELVINEHGHLKFSLYKSGLRNAKAKSKISEDGRVFEFENASSIYFDQSGILKLVSHSSDQKVYAVHINHPGTNLLAMTKMVKERTSLGLSQAKDVVTSPNGFIASFANYEDARRLKVDLEEIGGSIEITETPQANAIYLPLTLEFSLGAATDICFTGNKFFFSDELQQDLVQHEPRRFYNQYIQPFLDNIVSNGTKA